MTVNGARHEKRIEKLQIMVSDSEVAMVDEWRFENRSPSRSAAIRALISLGLEYHREKNGAAGGKAAAGPE